MNIEEQDNLMKELESLKKDVQRLKKEMLEHGHSGRDGSENVSQENILPPVRAVGSVTMATDGRVYKIGIPRGCKNISFNAIAFHYSGDVWESGSRDARVIIIGNAYLGQSFNLQPDTTSSVVVGGLLQNIIQSSINQVVVGSTLTSNISEYYLASVVYPSAGVYPVVLEITKYEENFIEVTATLSAGWGVIGNFNIS